MAMRSAILIVGLAGVLAGCVTVSQTGPTLDATPGRGKSLEQFSQNERACQVRAWNAVGRRGNGREVTLDNTIAATAIGAGSGALIGSAFGHLGSGAAIGTGAGLMVGSFMDERNARAARGPTQAKYDSVYRRCMVARGHRVAR